MHVCFCLLLCDREMFGLVFGLWQRAATLTSSLIINSLSYELRYWLVSVKSKQLSSAAEQIKHLCTMNVSMNVSFSVSSESSQLIFDQYPSASLITVSQKHHALCLQCLHGNWGVCSSFIQGKVFVVWHKVGQRRLSHPSLNVSAEHFTDWASWFVLEMNSWWFYHKDLNDGCWELKALQRPTDITQKAYWVTKSWHLLSLSVHCSVQAHVSIQWLHRPGAQFSLPAHWAGTHQQSSWKCEYELIFEYKHYWGK